MTTVIILSAKCLLIVDVFEITLLACSKRSVRSPIMSLSNSKLVVTHKDVFDASTAIQTYVAAILKQTDIVLDELPDLPTYQKVARQHAELWLNQVLPAIINTNADIIDYANGFLAFYDTLVKLAEQIDTGDKSQVEKFAEGLVLLRNNISRKESQAKYTETQLEDFSSKLNVDHDIFTKQAAAATKVLEGADGQLEKISGEIDTINSQLNVYIGVMSGGAVGIVGGIVMILVGSFAAIETAGISTGLVVAGAGLLVGGIGAEITGGVEYGLAVEKKKELQESLAADKQGIGILKHINGLLDGFVNQMDSAIKSAGVLRQQWTLLSDNLDQVIADLDKNPGSLGLVAMLKTAKGDWENALDLARRMQPRGSIPVKDVANIMDVIHASQKPQRSS